jgi:hypothetical protein
MNAKVRRTLDMGARALEFGHAHPLESPGYVATITRLEERMGRADMLATQQRDGILAVRAATRHKRELAQQIRRAHLNHLARIADQAASELPELPQKFLLKPGKGSFRAFRTAARGMQVEAQARRQELVKHGLVETVLDDLGRLLDELDAVSERSQEARRVHIGATAQLEVVADEVARLVRALGGLNQYRFAKDPELLAQWESASSVVPGRRGEGVKGEGGKGEGVQGEGVGDVRPAA